MEIKCQECRNSKILARIVQQGNRKKGYFRYLFEFQSQVVLKVINATECMQYFGIMHSILLRSFCVFSARARFAATKPASLRRCMTMFFDSPEPFVDAKTFFDDLSTTAIHQFAYSFESRLIGTIVGNVLAGIAFKVLADVVTDLYQDWQAKRQPKTMLQKVEAIVKPPIQSPIITKEAWAKLVLCIMIDAVSDSSFLIPGIGEIEDIAWAPLAALAMKYLFNSDAVAMAEFVKELLPFTDIIPLACTVWLLENVFVTSPLVKILNILPKTTRR